MRFWKFRGDRDKRPRSQDEDIERGVFATVILTVLMLFAIGIGTVAEMLSAGSLP